MKDKKGLLILIAVFVLLIGGASMLYTRLGSQLTPDRLTVQEPAQTEAPTEATTPTETETLETEPAAETTTPTEETAAPENLAPDFTVYDSEGNEVHLSDFFGKPIVLNFWASWCGPCKMEMPDFNEMHLELEGEVVFLMVNMTDGQRETVEIASDFIAAQGYTFPVFFDTASSAAMTYGVYSLPTTYFINARGEAIAQAIGAIDADTLQRGIDMIR